MSFPALRLLAQGYLTLDWPDDYADVWAAVDDYMARESIASELPNEIARLVAAGLSDDMLHALVIDDLGCGYLPQADGYTTGGWLVAVGEHVREALDS